jgi:hypothetical protein
LFVIAFEQLDAADVRIVAHIFPCRLPVDARGILRGKRKRKTKINKPKK